MIEQSHMRGRCSAGEARPGWHRPRRLPLSRVEFELWTDGACSGNPGPGGWAAILVARRADGTIAKQLELSGGEPLTTNNRMELRAVIEGLRALQRASAVTVHIDSSYVMDAITKRWYAGWKARGWTTSSKQPSRTASCGRRCSSHWKGTP